MTKVKMDIIPDEGIIALTRQLYKDLKKPNPFIHVFHGPLDWVKDYRSNKTDRDLRIKYSYKKANDPLYRLKYDIFLNIIGVTPRTNFYSLYSFKQRYISAAHLFELCSGALLFENNASLMINPTHVEVDNDNRLHCEDGYALEFKDGYKAAFWHGQEIPVKWIENKPSAAEVLAWKNMDQRSAGCELIGWNNILDELKAKVIDDSGNPTWGVLIEVKLPVTKTRSTLERFLKVKCGTDRVFALPVPPDTKTVDDAQSILHGGLPVEILKFSVDRT